MDEVVRHKIKYILLRYKVDSKDLDVTLRLELLKRWIKSCVDAEEYEMASVLRDKRNELIRSLRLVKKGNRHVLDNLILVIKWKFRKIKIFFLL